MLKHKLLLLLLSLLADNIAWAFHVHYGGVAPGGTKARLSLEITNDGAVVAMSRREALMSSAILVSLSIINPGAANADVSDGNALPQGAAQFSRVLRLKNDLQGVKKRVATGGSDIDKQEWDNIGRFLRTAYGVGDDMKAVGSGVADLDKRKQALNDVELLRQYAQAGEIPVNKKSVDGLVPVLDKMSAITDDFLDALSDVPDEI